MNQRYPVSFIKKGEYESSDFRFIDVSIDVMHTGANLNKTSFTKDAINKAVPTIRNTPILGYVVDELDEEDKDFLLSGLRLRSGRHGSAGALLQRRFRSIPRIPDRQGLHRRDRRRMLRDPLLCGRPGHAGTLPQQPAPLCGAAAGHAGKRL